MSRCNSKSLRLHDSYSSEAYFVFCRLTNFAKTCLGIFSNVDSFLNSAPASNPSIERTKKQLLVSKIGKEKVSQKWHDSSGNNRFL